MAGTSANKLNDLVTQAPEDDASAGRIPNDQQESDVDDEAAGPCGCRCPLFRRSSSVVRETRLKPTAVVPSSSSSAVRQHAPAASRSAPEVAEDNGQLGPQTGCNIGRKTLVLDLDETLVHSSFRTVPGADIIISVELEGESHQVFVRKRPGVDEFMRAVAELFEVVVYTASMAKYANPLLDVLDPEGLVASRLFREACTRQQGCYIKDLSKLGRDLKNVIIIDNSPMCYALQPANAIPIKTWREDPHDQELPDLVPILRSLVAVEDIPVVLRQVVWTMEE
mmetsp:Transcript_26990/g.68644  ORF Transcript_26990/g.68644 Transcript_26990/m.68644 type:complete len:281 (-) Transcript_26990:199-1041(-)